MRTPGGPERRRGVKIRKVRPQPGAWSPHPEGGRNGHPSPSNAHTPPPGRFHRQQNALRAALVVQNIHSHKGAHARAGAPHLEQLRGQRWATKSVAPSVPAVAQRPLIPPPMTLPTATRSSSLGTMRPPPSPEWAIGHELAPESDRAVPIPLTRLHTPRPRYQSAIDMTPAPTGEDAAVRETSSATLPPLVASLPPPGPPLFVPRPSAPPSARPIAIGAMGGAASLLALVAVLCGVAVGRHVAHPSEEGAVHVVGTHPASNVVASPESQRQPGGPAMAKALPWPTTDDSLAQGAAAGPTPVEALPPAPAAAPLPAVEPRRAPPAPVAARPVAARPAAVPAAPTGVLVAAGATTAGSPSPTGVSAAPAAAPRAEKDTTGSNGSNDPGRAEAAPADPNAAGAKAAAPAQPPGAAAEPAEPPSDPLVKAIRADIEEDEARHK